MKLNEVLDIRTPFINKVVNVVDKISRKKNSPITSDDKQAIIASLQHNIKKHGESLDVVLDVVEKVFRKRMTKAGRYSDYSRASDALRQSFTHEFKDKNGVNEMKFNDIFGAPKLNEVRDRGIPDGDDYEERKLLDQEDKERRLMSKTSVQPVTSANANSMTKKEMEEYDLYLVVDKKTFGFNVGGTFLVTGMKFKPDGGLMVKVPKQQRGSGEIFIPSNRSGTKFILSKGPDSGPSVPVDTHVAVTLFNRGINEGKEQLMEATSQERLFVRLLKKYNAAKEKEFNAYTSRNSYKDKGGVTAKYKKLEQDSIDAAKEFIKNFGYLKDEKGNRLTLKNLEAYNMDDVEETLDAYRDQLKESLNESESEWESRHDEFVKVGESVSLSEIKDLVDKLKKIEAKVGKKTGMLNQIFGSKSSGENARSAYAAGYLAKGIDSLKNAKLGTDDRKELGQKVVYARSLIKRVNESLTESNMSELEMSLPDSWKNSEVVWGGRGKKTNAKIVIINHDGNKFTVMRLGNDGWEVKSKDHHSLEAAQAEIKNMVEQ